MKKTRRLTPEQLKKKQYRSFKSKIRNIFVTAGFEYLNTVNKHTKIGNRAIEIDSVFIYENILLVCEDTGTTVHVKDHIRKKKEAFDEISNNISDFYEWLSITFQDNSDNLKKYSNSRRRTFFLYFSQYELNLTNDDYKMYSSIKFVEPQTLNYFHKMSQCIKKTIRYEIFRFLNIDSKEIGIIKSKSSNTISTSIICPKDSTGMANGVRIVSFMMSAEDLMGTCYVLRKDNWEDSIHLYQRLIEKEKIKNIRLFLAKKGEAFLNNIIIGLPDDVRFTDSECNPVSIDDISDYQSCQIVIPNKINSICVIDGQHRIFAHYEGLNNDPYEEKISELREKLHLLVTGLIFPKNMSKIERAQIQSQIFLDINSNAKLVPADVLLHIEMVKNPFSDIGLARQVIELLNKEQIFLKMFELSLVNESKKIKVASIIKFALRYLVTLTPAEGKVSFFSIWDGDKDALQKKDDKALEEYIKFCASNLSIYFSAVKKNFKEAWLDNNSKILSVISINGFIIAYNRQLEKNGIQCFDFYDTCMKKLKIDFSNENFPYTSSQYRKFSEKILNIAFDIWEDSNPTVSEIRLSVPEDGLPSSIPAEKQSIGKK